MTRMKAAKTTESAAAPARARPRVRVVTLGKLKPLSKDAHERMHQAARDPKGTAGRRFPTIKD